MPYNRLATEDELEFFSGDEFFQPQDLSFVAQPATPAAQATASVVAPPAPVATAPALIFSPPKGVIFEGSPEALAARYEQTTEQQGTQFIDPYAGLSTSPNLAGAAPVLGFTGEALYDPSRAAYQGSLENYSPAYELTPEYKQFLSERGYQFGTWSKPGVNGQYFGVFDPTGKFVPGTEQFQSNENRAFGLATALIGAGVGALGAPIGLLQAAASRDPLSGIAALAGVGGYGDVANAARLAAAAQNKDVLGAVAPMLGLTGTGDIGGFSSQDINKAVNVARAATSKDPAKLLTSLLPYAPAGSPPGYTPSDLEEGFFETGGPGYLSESGELPQSEVDRELASLLGRYKAPEAPSDWFLGENVPSGVPEWDFAAAQAGLPVGNLEQDFYVAQAKEGPVIVDSAGNVGTFVDGEFVPDTGLTPDREKFPVAPPTTAKPPTAKTPDTKAPGTPSKGIDPMALLAAIAAMSGGQKPEAAEPYQLANVAPGVQAGLKALEQMYGRG